MSRWILAWFVVAGLAVLGEAIWFTWDDPVRAEAVWVLGQLVVLSAAAVFGWRQLAEARRLRLEQARPYVSVDLDPWSRRLLFLIVVENYGRTVARDVRVSFEPELASTVDATHGDGPRRELNIWREGIPVLVPGKRMYCILDGVTQALEAVAAGELPRTYTATVTYTGTDGTTYGPEEYVLDIETYKGLAVKVTDDPPNEVKVTADLPLPVHVTK